MEETVINESESSTRDKIIIKKEYPDYSIQIVPDIDVSD